MCLNKTTSLIAMMMALNKGWEDSFQSLHLKSKQEIMLDLPVK